MSSTVSGHSSHGLVSSLFTCKEDSEEGSGPRLPERQPAAPFEPFLESFGSGDKTKV